jgi:hypothetical protein
MRPIPVHVGAHAREVGRALPPERAGRLRRAIRRASAADRTPGLFLVRTPRDVAACELLEDPRVLLVYEIRPVRELMRMLVGDQIDDAVRRRSMGRLAHSRTG